jgi:hypothetical protein
VQQARQSLKIIAIATQLGAAGLVAERPAFGPPPAEQLQYAINPKRWGETPRTYWRGKEGKALAYSGALDAATLQKYMAK